MSIKICAQNPLGGWDKLSNVALLILTSAGTDRGIAHEESCEDNGYLEGSGMNAAMAQNYFMPYTGQGGIRMANFSIDANGLQPEAVVKKFFRDNLSKNIVLFYTGHGTKDGSWAFTLYGEAGWPKVYISPQNVTAWYREATAGRDYKSLSIFAQCCYSGFWAMEAFANPDLYTQVCTSAKADEPSKSSKTGSEASKFWFEGGPQPQFSTSMMYGWSFTSHDWCYDWIDLFAAMRTSTMHTGLKIGAMTFTESGKCRVSFQRPEYTAGVTSTYAGGDLETVWSTILKKTEDGFKVRHMTCGNRRYGVYFEKGFGQHQRVAKGATEFVTNFISERWKEGYKVTSICNTTTNGYIVAMTKGPDTKDFTLQGGGQIWRTRANWGGISTEIDKGYADGYVITSLCHSKTEEQYFLVMTKSSVGQTMRWGENNGPPAGFLPEKWKENYSISTMFGDSDNRTLYVMSTGCGWNYREVGCDQ